MIARLAKAMQAESANKPFSWENAARAAIAALGEPTDAMRLAGTDAGGEVGKEIARCTGGGAEIAVIVVTGDGRLYDAAWRAMIDVALTGA